MNVKTSTAPSECATKKHSYLRKQKTIASPQEFSGIGLHTGQEVHMRLCPAKEGSGIFFKRTDLKESPVVPATIEYVFDTSRSTNIALGDVKIYTVEHVLAAVKAFDIDNLCIELSGIEPPAGNGSSDIFVDMIERAGVIEQTATSPLVFLKTPVAFCEKDVQIVAIPSDEYRISYTLHYPQSKALGTQFHSLLVNAENFKKEIASCRTFALYEELSFLIDKGLIKGASLDNSVCIKDDAVISKGGVFFPNEMVRHKILDLIGDLSLIGMSFSCHIIAIRSGHATNYKFAKKLFNHISMENM